MPNTSGSLLLDRHRPGWRASINLDCLNMAQRCNCILGQLWGDYAAGLRALGIDDFEARRLGFSRAGISYLLNGDDPEWAELTAAWRRIVEVSHG